MLLQIVGTIAGAGLFAYGTVFAIIGWTTSVGGPNILEIFWVAPEVVTHPWFLPIWGALVVILGLVGLVSHFQNRP